MKKLLGVLLIVGLILSTNVQPSEASTLTQTLKCFGDGSVCRLTLKWVATVTSGAFTATAIDAAKITTLAGYYLYEMETDPGTPAPQDNYDITLTATATGYSYDILGGRGADRSTTVSQAVLPANTTGSFYPAIGNDTYTLAITGNNVSVAEGVIRLWFVK